MPCMWRKSGITRGRFGMFIGCSNYPECEHTELIDKPDETAITCPNAGRAIWFSAAPVMAKHFTPVIATGCQFAINFKPIAGECPECHYPLLIEKKTAQGVKHFCASKQCGKPISAE